MKTHDDITILIIEDDPGHAKLVELVLREIGVKLPLMMFANGIDAEAFLFSEGSNGPNERTSDLLVLLDLNLPGTDGHVILKRMKETPETRTIPVVVITSSADLDEEERCKELGADAFIIKPPEPAELKDVLYRLGLPGL